MQIAPGARVAPSPSIAGPCGARAALWRALTQHGARAVEQRHDSRARQLHEEALSEAEALLCAAEERVTEAVSDLAPAAYLTSCHNVAELARRQDDIETQAIFLYQGYERLVSVAESAKAPLELRSACVQHLRVASDALVAYLATHGMADAAFTYTERAKAAARQVSSLVQVSPS